MARGGARPGSGPKKGAKPKWFPLKKTENPDGTPTVHEDLTPLEYMLREMNDTSNPKDFRARMAQAAAPFVHARADIKGGKKQEKEDAAKSAVARFAPGSGPKIVPIRQQV